MAEYIGQFFIDVETIPDTLPGLIQLLFLAACYAFVLFTGSSMISDGSELLLLVPSLEGLVGSIVLPILGAVPDGAMVLFSGLGPDAQEQLNVGIGALAGSTIMLLTLPWFLAVVAGRVTLKANGEGNYEPKKNQRLQADSQWSLTGTGINCDPRVSTGGKLMAMTSLGYVIIQGPAFALHCGYVHDAHCHPEGEKWYAFGGFLLCSCAFVAYLVYKVKSAEEPTTTDAIDRVKEQRIKVGFIPLTAAYAKQISMLADDGKSDAEMGSPDAKQRIEEPLKSYFNRYDKNGDGYIDKVELVKLLDDMNEKLTDKEFDSLMRELDGDSDGKITFEEFFKGVPSLFAFYKKRGDKNYLASGAEDEEEDDEDGPEIEEEWKGLKQDELESKVKAKSFKTMFYGVSLVLLFSDPMVDVLSNLGERIGVSSFYVAFVLAPLASNASELLAAFNYASKKTLKSVTISLETLQGAACMNNTFCLSIFLALVFFRSLSWEFSAETVSILTVELIMAGISMKTCHRLLDAFIVVSLYPGALALVYFLERNGFN